MQDSSPEAIVGRLYNSFSELERAIVDARATLAKRGEVPEYIFDRLATYDQIIAKQRNLAKQLEGLIVAGDIKEISRHVTIINSLSGMIIDDAKEILAKLSLGTPFDQEEEEQDGSPC